MLEIIKSSQLCRELTNLPINLPYDLDSSASASEETSNYNESDAGTPLTPIMGLNRSISVCYMMAPNYEEVLIDMLVSIEGDALSTWTNYSLKEGKYADNTLNGDVKSNSTAALGLSTLPGRALEDDAHTPTSVSTRLVSRRMIASCLVYFRARIGLHLEQVLTCRRSD